MIKGLLKNVKKEIISKDYVIKNKITKKYLHFYIMKILKVGK